MLRGLFSGAAIISLMLLLSINLAEAVHWFPRLPSPPLFNQTNYAEANTHWSKQKMAFGCLPNKPALKITMFSVPVIVSIGQRCVVKPFDLHPLHI